MGTTRVMPFQHIRHRDQQRLLYILAPSYSGSTLLTFLLARHPKISTIGELKATAMGDLDRYMCSCGQRLRECGFWRSVSERMVQRGLPFALEEFGTHFHGGDAVTDKLLRASVRNGVLEAARRAGIHLWPGARHRLHRILEQNRALMEIISDLQDGEIFLDGSKDAIRLEFLRRSQWCNVKAVYLMRDGRGVTSSYMRHYEVSMDVAAREWVRTCTELDRVADVLGNDACLRVRYEDLCRNPEATVSAICKFMRLDPQELQATDDDRRAHILGNSMRLSFANEIRIDERWRTTLSSRDMGVFEAMAGGINQQLGYA